MNFFKSFAYLVSTLCALTLFTGCAAKSTKASQIESQSANAQKKLDQFYPLQIKESLVSINIIDRNGLSETISSKERVQMYQNVDFLSPQPYQKVLRAFAKNKLGENRSVITSYHSNGEPKQYLEAIGGRAHGTYCEWHANGKKKLLATIIEGGADLDEKAQLSWSFDKVCFAWDEDGNLETQIPYEKGDIHGKALYYHPGGKLAQVVPYAKDEVDGEIQSFSSDVLLIESSQFCKGLAHGPSIGYWLDENQKPTIQFQEQFQNDLLEEASYYDKAGALISTITHGLGKRCLFDDTGPAEFYEYKDGKAEGEVTIFENNKTLCCRYFLKDDQKHGEELRYYTPKPFSSSSKNEKLIPKLSIQWYEGKIHGMVRSWYEDGTPESQREMSQNEKQGHLTAWYRNGSLMLIEEYEKGRLIRGEYLKKGETAPVSQIEHGKRLAMLYDGEGNFYRKARYQDGKPLDE